MMEEFRNFLYNCSFLFFVIILFNVGVIAVYANHRYKRESAEDVAKICLGSPVRGVIFTVVEVIFAIGFFYFPFCFLNQGTTQIGDFFERGEYQSQYYVYVTFEDDTEIHKLPADITKLHIGAFTDRRSYDYTYLITNAYLPNGEVMQFEGEYGSEVIPNKSTRLNYTMYEDSECNVTLSTQKLDNEKEAATPLLWIFYIASTAILVATVFCVTNAYADYNKPQKAKEILSILRPCLSFMAYKHPDRRDLLVEADTYIMNFGRKHFKRNISFSLYWHNSDGAHVNLSFSFVFCQEHDSICVEETSSDGWHFEDAEHESKIIAYISTNGLCSHSNDFCYLTDNVDTLLMNKAQLFCSVGYEYDLITEWEIIDKINELMNRLRQDTLNMRQDNNGEDEHKHGDDEDF